MLSINETQMSSIAQRTFYGRLEAFIDSRSRRNDFKMWSKDFQRLHGLWHPMWAVRERHCEHDLALAMVVMAASSYAKIPLQGDALAVLRGVAGAEVRIKSWLASGGYFDFTAFDTPDHDAITANPTLP